MRYSQCENFDTFVIRDMCKIINQRGQYWSDLIAQTNYYENRERNIGFLLLIVFAYGRLYLGCHD